MNGEADSAAEQDTDEAAIRSLVDRYFAAYARKDLDAMADLVGSAVANAGLESLASFPKLESLALSGGQIGDEGMVHVAGCRSLRHLTLLYTRVGDSGLARLADLKEHLLQARRSNGNDHAGQFVRAVLEAVQASDRHVGEGASIGHDPLVADLDNDLPFQDEE